MSQSKVAVKWIELILVLLIILAAVGIGLGSQQITDQLAKRFEPTETRSRKLVELEVARKRTTVELEKIQAAISDQHLLAFQLKGELDALEKRYPSLGSSDVPTDTLEIPITVVTSHLANQQELESTTRLLESLQLQQTTLISETLLHTEVLNNTAATDAEHILAQIRLDFTTERLDLLQEKLIETELAMVQQRAAYEASIANFPLLAATLVELDFQTVPPATWIVYLDKLQAYSTANRYLEELEHSAVQTTNRLSQIEMEFQKEQKAVSNDFRLQLGAFSLIRSLAAFLLAGLFIAALLAIVRWGMLNDTRVQAWSLNRQFVIWTAIAIVSLLVGFQILGPVGAVIAGSVSAILAFSSLSRAHEEDQE